VEDGHFVSDEPSELVSQQIMLTSDQDGELTEMAKAVIIEEISDTLDVDARYISFEGAPLSAADPWNVRALSVRFSITILSENGSAIALALADLASSQNFWRSIDDLLMEKNVPLLLVNVSDVVVGKVESRCNMHFDYDNVTHTCTAKPIKCEAGTYAAAGTNRCTGCPRGKHSSSEGANTCESCMPGHFNPSQHVLSCAMCERGHYQPAALGESCLVCPRGKFTNKQATTICSEAQSMKSYITVQGHTSVEVGCPKSGIGAEVNCGNGFLTFRTEGYFHDGLEAAGITQTHWTNRRGYTINEHTLFCEYTHSYKYSHNVAR
jgi:hypothetical protein